VARTAARRERGKRRFERGEGSGIWVEMVDQYFVRELENTVNRLAIFAPTGRVTLADIEAESRRSSEEREPADTASPTPDRLLEVERQHILRVLKQTRGNRSEAARRLGIERKTLYKKALRLGIDLLDTGRNDV
jgi:two-component system response regulator AtoC